MVAHRDRLARFGFELIEWLVQQNGGTVVVLNQSDASPESELTEDLLAILHTFSCRMHGLRRCRAAIAQDTDLSEPTAEGHDSNLAGSQPMGYNLTVEVLQHGIPAVWRHIASMVMAEVRLLKPEWESVPLRHHRG